MKLSKRTELRRIPDRGSHDWRTINHILDAGFLASVGFCVDGQPFVFPTLYGRDGERLYLYGSAASRMLRELETGIPACATVTIVDGLQLENVSPETIRIDSIRLKMPWFDGDFRWLKKLSSKSLRERGGYVLPACGPCGFEESVVLNHLLVRDFKLYPGDVIEGFLLGEGAASVPEEFRDRTKVPMQLVVYSGRGKSYSERMELVVSREAHQVQCKPVYRAKETTSII